MKNVVIESYLTITSERELFRSVQEYYLAGNLSNP